MSGTKRTRIDRPPQARLITPHAIELFKKLRQAETARSPQSCIRGETYDIVNYCSKHAPRANDGTRLTTSFTPS
jgi:hypothetical protein